MSIEGVNSRQVQELRQKENQLNEVEKEQDVKLSEVSVFASDTTQNVNADAVALSENQGQENLQDTNKNEKTKQTTPKSVFKEDSRIKKDDNGNRFVKVDLWEDSDSANDCLTRIIANSYDLKSMGIKMYSDEYYALEKAVMDANPEIYGNEQGGWREEIGGTGRCNAVIYDDEKINLPTYVKTVENPQPSKPVQPAKPSKPEESSKPVKPSKPEEPSKPAEPSKPVEPSKPAEPSKPQAAPKVDNNAAKADAEAFYNIAATNTGITSMGKMQSMLDEKVDSKNITAFLDAYDKVLVGKNDSSIVDTITSEIGANKEEQKKVLTTLMDKLSEAAKEAGVPDEDIKKAKSDYEESMNKEMNALFRRTNPKDMEKSVDFLRGAILAKQNGGADMSDSEAIELFNESFSQHSTSANSDFASAREQEGWSAKVGDTVLGWFGCNTEEDLKAKLGDNAEAVKKLASSKDEAEFKKNYKEVFGIEFDSSKISARQNAVNKYQTAKNCEITMNIADEILKTNGSYTDMASAVKEKLHLDDDTLNQILTEYANQEGKTNPSDTDKKALIEKFLNNTKTSVSNQLKAVTNGESLEKLENDLNLITKSTFGTSDIVKDVTQFNENQKTTATATLMAGEIAGTIALQFVPGLGQVAAARLAASTAKWGSVGLKMSKAVGIAEKGFGALNSAQKGNAINSASKFAGVTNKGLQIASKAGTAGMATFAVDISDGKSVEDATRKAFTNMSFAGVGATSSVLAPKLMSVFGLADKKLAVEIAQEIMNGAGTYGITKANGVDYSKNDAFINFASGLIMARLSSVAKSKIQNSASAQGVNSAGNQNVNPKINAQKSTTNASQTSQQQPSSSGTKTNGANPMTNPSAQGSSSQRTNASSSQKTASSDNAGAQSSGAKSNSSTNNNSNANNTGEAGAQANENASGTSSNKSKAKTTSSRAAGGKSSEKTDNDEKSKTKGKSNSNGEASNSTIKNIPDVEDLKKKYNIFTNHATASDARKCLGEYMMRETDKDIKALYDKFVQNPSSATLKKLYSKAMVKYHPDRNQANKESAEELSKLLNKINDILKKEYK